MQPLILHTTVSLAPPTDDDRRAFDQRVRDGLGLSPLTIPLSLLRSFNPAKTPRELSCSVCRTADGWRLVDAGRTRSYAVALDIGTTNLVGLLYDNRAQKDVLTKTLENPQIAFGSDIMTRLHHALSAKSTEVSDRLLQGVNKLIESLCREAGVDAKEIHAMAVAGNTAMTHFFLGLDVRTIPAAPFVPVVRSPGFFIGKELGLHVNPEAAVYVFPNAGSYVGGDITAGILATDMDESAGPSILIDVGTNAEVVIGNREWMIVGAGAAGPALEEGVTRIGRRATSGVVYDVEIRDGNLSCKTFDGKPPAGICGSGMVSLLYELHRSGIVDQTGTLRPGSHVATVEGERVFTLCDDGLYITQSELRNFLRSKAAMFTLLLTLTRSVGIAFGGVERVFVSGALGTGIDAAKATGIGMLPAWPGEIVRALGNTSLAGCRMLLRDASLAGRAEELVGRITYKPMQDDPEFMKEYLGAVFIPHTQPELLKV